MGPRKNASNRAPPLLRQALPAAATGQPQPEKLSSASPFEVQLGITKLPAPTLSEFRVPLRRADKSTISANPKYCSLTTASDVT